MAAYGELVHRHQNRLYHSLYRMLGSREDADDVAQEAFVTAFQKLETFRGDSQFYSWLFRIAYNTAISMKRKARLKTVSADQLKESSGQEPDDTNPDHAPGHAIDVEETQAVVQQALNELSEEYRQAIVLKEMENLSYEEIAELADVPVGTIRSRLHRHGPSYVRSYVCSSKRPTEIQRVVGLSGNHEQ